MQTYDELLADDFQLVDTSEPEKVFTKQGKLRALPAPCAKVLALHLLASMVTDMQSWYVTRQIAGWSVCTASPQLLPNSNEYRDAI